VNEHQLIKINKNRISDECLPCLYLIRCIKHSYHDKIIKCDSFYPPKEHPCYGNKYYITNYNGSTRVEITQKQYDMALYDQKCLVRGQFLAIQYLNGDVNVRGIERGMFFEKTYHKKESIIKG